MKKIKEIKEDEEAPLLEEIKFKSQAAMEYLMTYGWAILIIALSLVVLYSLGIMNPKNFIPRAPPGSCFVFRPNGPGTTDFISLQGTCGYLPMYVASFNGVSSYVVVPDSAGLDVTNAITIVAWVNARDLITNTGVLEKRDSNPDGYGWMSGYADNKIYFEAVSLGIYVTSSILKTNTWYHLASTYSSADAKARFYVNGVITSEQSISGSIATTTARLFIGSRGIGNSPSGFFNGSIANVQIYNTALTPQEIQYLYQQGLGGGPVRLQNLVAWWPLNGDAKDYSGNNLHGTIYGVTFVQNYNPP